MRLVFFTILILITGYIKSQEVDVIWKSNATLSRQLENAPFHYLDPSTQSGNLIYLAKIKALGKDGSTSVPDLFNMIRREAQMMGANSFRFVEYNPSNNSLLPVLILNIYYSPDSLLEINSQNKEKNILYIFPGDNKIHRFKINGNRVNLKPDQYYRYQIKTGERVNLNKGGFLGTTLVVKQKEDQSNIYYSLSGVGLGSGMPYDGMGVSITTGKIYYMNESIGRLLMHVMEEKK